MKYTAIFTGICLLCVSALDAQNAALQNGLQDMRDSIAVQRPPLADSSLVGKSIFNLVLAADGKGSVRIDQPRQMGDAFSDYLYSNPRRRMNGYRIRLFFDNRQSARNESEVLEKDFLLKFPLIPVYRSYTNPFFKVVVGDYRTKSEAIKALGEIIPLYPHAIVVKDIISYPAL